MIEVAPVHQREWGLQRSCREVIGLTRMDADSRAPILDRLTDRLTSLLAEPPLSQVDEVAPYVGWPPGEGDRLRSLIRPVMPRPEWNPIQEVWNTAVALTLQGEYLTPVEALRADLIRALDQDSCTPDSERKSVQPVLEVLRDPDSRVRIRTGRTINTVQVTDKLAALIETMLQAEGNQTTLAEAGKAYGQRIRPNDLKIPPELKPYIKAKTGRGYWLVLRQSGPVKP
ncbi:MAG TPA: hypothetical protein VM533_15000 [Fimbriiglobus sp.]|nr:hypothetical protein [Fimbriiglobus sp.]